MQFKMTYMKTRTALTAIMATLGLGLVTGCETDGFLDASALGRWERTPVTMPILEKP